MAFYLYVKGYSSETTLVDLIMYFQSKESGGGDIEDEECKFEKDEALIAFDEKEDLQNVLKHDHHVFKECTLTISCEPFKTKFKPARRRRKPQENMTPPKPANNKPIIGKIKTIIVTGISPQTTDNTLQLCFENKRRSGGGDIENLQRVEPQVAHVTFTSAQVASSVLKKGNLEIDGYLLQLKAKKPEVTFPEDKKKLLIKNVHATTTKDGLNNYVELITRLDVKDLVLGNDNNAMVTLDNEPDMIKVTEKAKTKPLDGVVLRISNPPICHSVLMTGFNMETTKNAIKYKFENSKHGGGEILDIAYQQEQGKAVISFFDPNVIQSIISQEHILDGAKIMVCPYYPFLDEKVIDVARNIKKVIKVSPDVMDHMSNRCGKEFLQEFGFEIPTTYNEEKNELTFPTTLPTGELIERKIKAIKSYFNQFTVKEIEIPKSLFLKSKDEVEEKLKETMKDFRNEAHATIEDEKRCIVVTGKEKKVAKVGTALQKKLNELGKKKEMVTTRLHNLQSHKLMLILSLGFDEQFKSNSNIEVKIDPQKRTIELKGSKKLVESVKVQALEKLSKITEERINLTKSQEDYLMSGGLEKINDNLKKRNVEALICLNKSKPRKAIVELMDSEKFEEVQECLLEQDHNNSQRIRYPQKYNIRSEECTSMPPCIDSKFQQSWLANKYRDDLQVHLHRQSKDSLENLSLDFEEKPKEDNSSIHGEKHTSVETQPFVNKCSGENVVSEMKVIPGASVSFATQNIGENLDKEQEKFEKMLQARVEAGDKDFQQPKDSAETIVAATDWPNLEQQCGVCGQASVIACGKCEATACKACLKILKRKPCSKGGEHVYYTNTTKDKDSLYENVSSSQKHLQKNEDKIPYADSNKWECEHCTLLNSPETLVCDACSRTKDVKVQDHKPGAWECSGCTFANPENVYTCQTCKMEKGNTYTSFV